MTRRTVCATVVLVGLAAGAVGLTPTAVAEQKTSAAKGVTPELRRELLTVREAVWRAWFNNDRDAMKVYFPADTLAINAGEEDWVDQAAVLSSALAFTKQGGKLVRLEFPRTEIQLYGDVAILYSLYVFETETAGKRQTTAGRATEVFVRRQGRWVNPGWHTDSGK